MVEDILILPGKGDSLDTLSSKQVYIVRMYLWQHVVRFFFAVLLARPHRPTGPFYRRALFL